MNNSFAWILQLKFLNVIGEIEIDLLKRSVLFLSRVYALYARFL